MAINWPRDWSWDYGQPTELGRGMFGQRPSAAYQAAIRPAQLYGGRGFSNWLGANSSNYYDRYFSEQALDKIPQGMEFYDWLTGSDRFDPWGDFMRLAPYERGERPSAFAGRARWVP